MGDAAKTATVEVLTAEVRVLMVGARQVTLSVARQLDAVALEDIEPFGRIRTREHEYAVIGKERTGVLVVATYEPKPGIPRLEVTGITGCAHWQAPPSGYHRLVFEGKPFLIWREQVRDCTVHAKAAAPPLPTAPPSPSSTAERAAYDAALQAWHREHEAFAAARCATWQASPETTRTIAAALARWTAYVAACARAVDLPLIVLAGLR